MTLYMTGAAAFFVDAWRPGRARSAARREVARMMREEQEQPDINIISRPREDQLFLISNLDQRKLSRRYLLWSWAHLAIFFGALGGIGWVMQATDF